MEAFERDIRKYIYSMAHKAPHLISERNVAQHFNLKRNTVREIFLTLEGEGILERIPNRGYKLVDYSASNQRTIYSVRYMIEREAAKKALKNATREDIIRLTLILEEMDAIIKSEKDEDSSFYMTDMDFHQAFVQASHDNMLIRIFSFITTPVFGPLTPLSQLGATHAAHQKILDALKNSDETALMTTIERHLGKYIKIEDRK